MKQHFNTPEESLVWSDKSYLDYYIRDCKTVRTVVRNVSGRFLDEQFRLITMEEAQIILDSFPRLVIKPSMNTKMGRSVRLLEGKVSLQELAKNYNHDYVIQVPLTQHPDMAKLNASSVNTIRVNTILLGSKAHVMTAFVKVGQKEAFADNSGENRFFIGIKTDGSYCNYAIDHDLRIHESIPSGYVFAGRAVPGFASLCSAIEKAHECIPHFGFAFWDVCVDENEEPVIVEVNLRQPDTLIAQACGIGNFFGKYAEDVVRICKR